MEQDSEIIGIVWCKSGCADFFPGNLKERILPGRMSTVGIVAEFNPFHRGHEYLLKKASEMADNIVIVMSGNYVQRGAPAITAENYRAQAAMNAGADLVVELPVRYATSSAPCFAMAAVKILDSLGCCDTMLFGSEISYEKLKVTQKGRYVTWGRDQRDGYLRDRKETCKGASKETSESKKKRIEKEKEKEAETDSDIGSRLPSNAILASQYLKSLEALNSKIEPHVLDLSASPEKISASLLRKYILEGNLTEARQHMIPEGNLTKARQHMIPEESLTEFTENKIWEENQNEACGHMEKSGETEKLFESMKMDMSAFDEMLFSRLFEEICSGGSKGLVEYCDVDRDLAERITGHIKEYEGALQFTKLLKHKTVAYTRVSRALLHILLGIKKRPAELEGCFSPEVTASPEYIRVLGLRKEKSFLLKKSTLPVVTKIADAKEYPDLMEEKKAAFIYRKAAFMKYGTKMPDIYESPLIF